MWVTGSRFAPGATVQIEAVPSELSSVLRTAFVYARTAPAT
jgi:hypothetical protein